MNIIASTQIDWEELLDDIADGNLIPVIGNEIYKFNINNELVTADEYLASKLFEENGLTADPTLSLAEAIDYLEKEKNYHVRDLIRMLREIVDGISANFPLLNRFLEINQLRFYFNTTVYNNILENTIKKVRNQSPASINFSIRSKFPDCESIEELTAPLVFNVFGSFKSADPALSEEEMLEFTACFKERMNDNAKTILDALKNKSLLFLGCTHPDWLIRFFLRVLSNERMHDWLNRRSQIIVVNDLSNHRQKQYDFLKNYNTITYEGNTKEFVEELSEKWKQQHPSVVKSKTVFLSYTQKDINAAERFKQALANLNNVTCWYDKEKLFSGDNFETKITESIRDADLFIPLISENSLGQQDKYVYDEWFQAYTFSKVRRDRYMMPIAIDDVDLNNNVIKKFYPQMSIERVPDGKPDSSFIDRLKGNLNLI
jgi:hypothetical protein